MTRPSSNGDVHPILAAVERESEDALALLANAELDAFLRGDPIAGELGYARWRLAGGDRRGALDVLCALVKGSRRRGEP